MFEKLRGHRTKLIAAGLIVGAIVKLIDGASLGDIATEIMAAIGLLTARAPGAEALKITLDGSK